jgi:uncharacterized membrane protein
MTLIETTTPRTIDDYLAQLRHALTGADAAMIQDALSDAEAHLRAECAARPGTSEESVLRAIIGSYGSPTDVADAYRETEKTVRAALSTQYRATPTVGMTEATTRSPSQSVLRRFFGVYGDPYAWMAFFFMLLSLVTGIFYFAFAIIGLSLSLGLAMLIIGLPFFLAFIGMARVLALVEGRIIETVTGERMPRRVRPTEPGGLLVRIGAMLRDRRTWTTLAYQLLMLPLGLLYFSVAIALAALGIGLTGVGATGLLQAVGLNLPDSFQFSFFDQSLDPQSPWVAITSLAIGLVLTTLVLHLARAVGRLHGKLAKNLLVAR